MTRKEVEKLARTEESWRVEVLWRLDNLTWSMRQLAQSQQDLVATLRAKAVSTGQGRVGAA